jgi:4-hydroxymandelate oxidase
MSYAASRRHLLQFLAASPIFAQSALSQGLRWSDPVDWAPRDLDKLISDPTQALDVFDFEPVMKQNVPPAHFGYMATGVDDQVTLRPIVTASGSLSCARAGSSMSAGLI